MAKLNILQSTPIMIMLFYYLIFFLFSKILAFEILCNFEVK